MGTSTHNTLRALRFFPLHHTNQDLPAETAEEAIVYVTPNIHKCLFLEIWLMFLSIYSLSLCLGQHMLLLNLHRQLTTLLVLELAHSTSLKLKITILLILISSQSFVLEFIRSQYLFLHLLPNVISIYSVLSPTMLLLLFIHWV